MKVGVLFVLAAMAFAPAPAQDLVFTNRTVTFSNLQGQHYRNVQLVRADLDGLIWRDGPSGGRICYTNLDPGLLESLGISSNRIDIARARAEKKAVADAQYHALRVAEARNPNRWPPLTEDHRNRDVLPTSPMDVNPPGLTYDSYNNRYVPDMVDANNYFPPVLWYPFDSGLGPAPRAPSAPGVPSAPSASSAPSAISAPSAPTAPPTVPAPRAPMAPAAPPVLTAPGAPTASPAPPPPRRR